ncbi:MAG: hypothetical protein JXB45_06825 [Candidatus Krumholzibacteriota bacterium]|nr:hypothetical protein [Candidatus Krumholzibacteriota bacterium]
MSEIRTIVYDDKAAGRKVIPYPPDLPFHDCRPELAEIFAADEHKNSLINLAQADSIYEITSNLTRYVSIAEEPHREILRIAALAEAGEKSGIQLIYALVLAIPSVNQLALELIDFKNVARVMQSIKSRKSSATELMESEKWFQKKVMLLSLSLPLPNSDAADPESPWFSWNEGVRLAIADPDTRWDEAVLARVKIELEARAFRIRMIAASIDPERRENLAVSLGTLTQEIKWKLQSLNEVRGENDASPLVVRRKLENNWESISQNLRDSVAGRLLADILDSQTFKALSYPQVKTGVAVIKALLMNPLLRRAYTEPDILSCLHLFIESCGDGILEILVPRGSDVRVMLDIPGFSQEDKILRIDLSKLLTGSFTDDEGLPLNVDWTRLSLDKSLSFKSLVLSNMDNDSFLVQLLNNPKVINKPGIIPLIALRCRSSKVLSLVASRRELFTGFANKEVPLNLLLNPSKIPVTSLRKFIHVRYVDKMTLMRLANRGGGQVREEVRREIKKYLTNVN